MKKNYIVLASVWLASIVLMGAVIAFVQNSGIMAKFLPQKVLANPDCSVTDNVTVAGSLRITGPLYLDNKRTDCGTCNDSSTNHGELVLCYTGGTCSDWGLEYCENRGASWAWNCVSE